MMQACFKTWIIKLFFFCFLNRYLGSQHIHVSIEGKVSFNNRSLHAIGHTPNPYEQAITIIGKTLAPFDEDNLIPCFGFATTHDTEVFSFHSDRSSCHGFEEILDCYRKIVPNLRLAGNWHLFPGFGPTFYAPVIDAAVDVVENSGGQFHVLVIIADGQAIVLVGVGDGPWEDMKKFDDKIPSREFENFQVSIEGL
ncbi:E3 ubiquitin-protein ligase RGLG4-like [Hibiscus syriacus]|uniref:E3 ubiquitin-protein ligase RGLG4-like n=1 Tax=Hibiscus syriacus TaxID=106335 RepID=UPI0019223961|nr:E3 ubiquitin-protein ligase RGLG4-like [Hibiscus syriacus]